MSELVQTIARQLAEVSGYDWEKLSNKGDCGKWIRMADAVLALPEIDEALRAYDVVKDRVPPARRDAIQRLRKLHAGFEEGGTEAPPSH